MVRYRSALAAGSLLLGLMAAACSSDKVAKPNNDDIPEDPGTPAPALAPTTGDYVPSALSVSATPGNPDRIRVTVGGTLAEVDYTADNLTIVEDGVVKGIKLSSGAGAKLKTDIVFVIDNTGSMSSGIESVKNSVLAFVNALRSSGQDVQVGVVAYNDDGVNDANTTYRVPATDVAAHAAVYGYRPLTSNLATTGPVYTFIANLPAEEGGDSPELAFSGLDYARRTFKWRDGSQRVYIVITDITSWGKGLVDTDKGLSASYPWDDVTLGNQLRSEGSVVHCVCPENETYLSTGEYNVKPLATITGGTWTPWSYSEFDLTTLPILGVTSSTSLAEFVKSESGVKTEHTLRVVVEASSTARGERTLTVTY